MAAGRVMATADQLKALVRSHAEGDDTRFYSVAMQVAARASRGGQGRFAQELRNLIDEVRTRTPSSRRAVVAVVKPRGELAGLFSATYPETRMADMVLERPVQEKLERVILPLYYGLPFAYAEVMRSSIALNGSFFNTQRMVEQYVRNAYFPDDVPVLVPAEHG